LAPCGIERPRLSRVKEHLADLLGHSSIAVTGDIYGHTSDDTARAAVDGRREAAGFQRLLLALNCDQGLVRATLVPTSSSQTIAQR
jgi:hypothetical protein